MGQLAWDASSCSFKSLSISATGKNWNSGATNSMNITLKYNAADPSLQEEGGYRKHEAQNAKLRTTGVIIAIHVSTPDLLHSEALALEKISWISAGSGCSKACARALPRPEVAAAAASVLRTTCHGLGSLVKKRQLCSGMCRRNFGDMDSMSRKLTFIKNEPNKYCAGHLNVTILANGLQRHARENV